MGAGKTHTGKLLAEKLKIPFFDLDREIEQGERKTISRLFEEEGEAGFREKEKQYLQEGSYPGRFVLSTGGGAPCFFDNMDWMNRTGITVYLQADPNIIAARLLPEKMHRPLIRPISDEELPAAIAERLKTREPVYRQARLIIDNNNPPDIDQLAKQILDVRR